MLSALVSVLSLVILLCSATKADARAIEWHSFFHRSLTDAPSYKTTAAPTPRPTVTDTTRPAITTSPPQLPEVGYNTCGYYQGSADRPFMCGGGETCFTNSRSSAALCCSSSPCSKVIATACVDYAACQRGSCKITQSGTMYCGDKFPYCAKFTYLDIRASMIQCAASSTDAGTIEMRMTSTVVNTLKGASSKSTTAPGTGVQTQTPVPATAGEGGQGGMSMENKIALGCGIGIGLPAALAGIYSAWKVRNRGL